MTRARKFRCQRCGHSTTKYRVRFESNDGWQAGEMLRRMKRREVEI
ncbi:MAG: hypothetical protein ACE5GD_09995 [Candidatus Geothermarchaeales archaeon]